MGKIHQKQSWNLLMLGVIILTCTTGREQINLLHAHLFAISINLSKKKRRLNGAAFDVTYVCLFVSSGQFLSMSK